MMNPVKNIIRKLLPSIAAVFTFFCVMMVTETIKKNDADAYLRDLEHHKRVAREAVSQSQKTNLVVQELEQRITVLAAENDALENRLESQRRNSQRTLSQVQKSKDSLVVAQTLLDSNVVLTQIVEHQDIVITSQAAEIIVLESQKTNLTNQIFVKDSINGILVADNQRLVGVVSTIPNSNPCSDKFLFCKIKKPSRTTSFVGGIVTTLSGLVILK